MNITERDHGRARLRQGANPTRSRRRPTCANYAAANGHATQQRRAGRAAAISIHQVFVVTPRTALRFGREFVHEFDLGVLIRNPVMSMLGAATLACAGFTVTAVVHGAPFGVDVANTLILVATMLVTGGAWALAGATGQTRFERMKTPMVATSRTRRLPDVALASGLFAATLAVVAVGVLLWQTGIVGTAIPVALVAALLACLLPTTTLAVRPTIGMAGIDRAIRRNLSAKCGAAVVAAGHIDTLVLDQGSAFATDTAKAVDLYPLRGVTVAQLRDAALLAALADSTPESRSIVRLALDRDADDDVGYQEVQFVPLSAASGVSGIDLEDGRRVRKGHAADIHALVNALGGRYPSEAKRIVEQLAGAGQTAQVVAEGTCVLGVIAFSDVLKPGIREHIARLGAAGIRTIMTTADDPVTAAAVARQAGVDDYVAEATAATTLALIREQQVRGRCVAMLGGAAHDAPALAQADASLASQSGSPAARTAADIIDLESDPNNVFELIKIGRQLRLKRDALLAFALAGDITKCLLVLPAVIFAGTAATAGLDVLQTGHPASVVLAALAFNLLAIPVLIAAALRRERCTPASGPRTLRINQMVYAAGGVWLALGAITLINAVLGAIV